MKSRLTAIGIYAVLLTAAIVFYLTNIIEHVHYIEGTAAAIAACITTAFFLTIVFTPNRMRIFKLITGSLFAALVLVSITAMLVRPYQAINTEIPERMALLEEHLAEQYPEREWEVERSAPGEHSLYTMLVTFEDEPEQIYLYDMNDAVVDGDEEIHAEETLEN
ncbi:hypothetical protein [Alkalicoccus daliensis]|uniref:Uncharacterized protein n=1 Tax=Alkalicoccus daliensis TaxID=745820 RepID=A0A1H0DQ71_9BACI|nr:hypothetical protein [Alkalicoccus daliensis]SDN72330.1 hypothetical protein SAMN04488053_10344 [Alkalicoccus daliensis]